MSQYSKEEILKELENKTLSYLLVELCEDNDLNKVKYILESDLLETLSGSNYKLEDKKLEIEKIIINGHFIRRCCESDKNFEIAKYLLSYLTDVKDESKLLDLREQVNFGILICSENGAVKIMNYLLNSKELEQYIKVDYNNLVCSACSNNQVEVIEYLISEPKAKEKIEYVIKNGELFQRAYNDANFDTFKTVLTMPGLKDKIDIHLNNDRAIKSLVYKKKLEHLQYLIFDLNIKKTESIAEGLNNPQNIELKKLFEKRELAESLKTELESNGNKAKKAKI